MSGPWPYVIALPVAYLLGALPVGLLAGKLSRGVDVRRYGSGSAGATNVLRTLGIPTAVPVLLLDGGKGALAVLIAGWVGGSDITAALAGVMVIIGHSWPVFAGFRGGKSVIAGLGAVFVLNPIAGACGLLGFIVAAAVRYVSVGSVVGSAAVFICLLVLVSLGNEPVVTMAFAVCALTIIGVRHIDNMVRLVRGEEHRIKMPSRPRRVGRAATRSEARR